MEVLLTKDNKTVLEIKDLDSLGAIKISEICKPFEPESVKSVKYIFKPDNNVTIKDSVLEVQNQISKIVIELGKYPKCPKCGSFEIVMFDSDDDICKKCNYYNTPENFK